MSLRGIKCRSNLTEGLGIATPSARKDIEEKARNDNGIKEDC